MGIEMVTLKSIDLGAVVLKPYSHVLVINPDDSDDITLQYEGLTLKINRYTFKISNLYEYFISKADYESAITEGSEISLVTKQGLIKYSVENISFKDGKTTYVNLALKVL